MEAVRLDRRVAWVSGSRVTQPHLTERSLECAHRAPPLAGHAGPLKAVLLLTTVFMLGEAAAGWRPRSLTLPARPGDKPITEVAQRGRSL